MMHPAMHDALNAIVPIYETYAYSAAFGPRPPNRGGITGRP